MIVAGQTVDEEFAIQGAEPPGEKEHIAVMFLFTFAGIQPGFERFRCCDPVDYKQDPAVALREPCDGFVPHGIGHLFVTGLAFGSLDHRDKFSRLRCAQTCVDHRVKTILVIEAEWLRHLGGRSGSELHGGEREGDGFSHFPAEFSNGHKRLGKRLGGMGLIKDEQRVIR